MNPEDAAPQDQEGTEVDEQRILRCRACGQVLAGEDDVVSVAGCAARRTFVNPAGVVHELITVVGVHDVRDHGERTEAFSWFPGWTWRFTACGSCRAFLGWHFEAVASGLQPERFHGLRVQALVLG